MTAMVVIAVVAAVVLFAITAKLRPGKLKKAEKWEKAEIMKQLLALSETENSRIVSTTSVGPRAGLVNKAASKSPSATSKGPSTRPATTSS